MIIEENERRFAVAGRFLYRESCINMVQVD